MRHITIIAPIDQTARITTIENKFHQLYDKSSEQNLIQKKKLLMRSNKKHSDAFNKAELVSTQSLRLLLTLKKLSKKAKTETKFNIENRSRTHITASMLRDQQGRLSHQRSKSSKYFNCLWLVLFVSKTPKQVIFNVINIFDIFLPHTLFSSYKNILVFSF